MNEKRLEKQRKKKALIKSLKQHWQLYIFLLPIIIYMALFEYAPMYGVQIAFKNFKPYLGITGSEWNNFEYFKRFFTTNDFNIILSNTLILSIYRLVAGFFPPIILAICLNYIPNMKFKKLVQNMTYAPHFISLVVLVNMITVFFGTSNGLVNNVLANMGLERVFFLGDGDTFRHLYVWSGVWQGVGWSSIIYLANLTNVNPELHEAARVDGATIMQRIRYIDISCLKPIVITMLILDAGKVMSVGFDKVYLMQNSFNLETSEIISTYVYKRGLLNAQFGYSTAVGLFNSVVNMILLLTTNKISKKYNETSIL